MNESPSSLDAWKPIITSDIDSGASAAAAIAKSRPALQEQQATQRIARTTFMGAAPRSKSNHNGLDRQCFWLGAGTPGDALGNVTCEVADRLAGSGAEPEITIDIQSKKPVGFDASEHRITSENAATLKFTDSTFEN